MDADFGLFACLALSGFVVLTYCYSTQLHTECNLQSFKTQVFGCPSFLDLVITQYGRVDTAMLRPIHRAHIGVCNMLGEVHTTEVTAMPTHFLPGMFDENS